ncbi:hypothetical protein [Haladaptatus sp. DJG-WS-42]|uniref:hypothetical protein n=1 Tax=Haladaptatus sp. DJG-WS-42 TaxID=3120516 RepID=UPI0030CB9469
MATERPPELKSTDTPWYDTSLALLVGIAVMGAMVFQAAVIRPSGLAPPPAGAIPLFVFNTTAAVMGFVLLRRTDAAGYAVSIVTGILVVGTVVLVGTGAIGETPSSNGIQAGPVVYTALGLALIVTSGVAWRKRAAAELSSTSSTPT